MDICSGYSVSSWISMAILGYLLDKYTWISLMDILLGYICISLGYLLDIFCGYFFLDMSERYPNLPKDIQEISFHIQRYQMISRDIQRYPEISNGGELQISDKSMISWNSMGGSCPGTSGCGRTGIKQALEPETPVYSRA